LRPKNKDQFLGEFHSKEGFLMGPIKKKGARSFWGKNKKCEKTDEWRHLANQRRTKLNNEK